ncbi:MarR family winged helix-turn-helix transcriptional regulator [Microbaculum sp. FT89]|uniref:MarR family winged helix-turn-helix transcriptional regulator n=1 Tax=Microbaculum sp. FT89 TaxID=3447298 RepID=UPI003F53065A
MASLYRMVDKHLKKKLNTEFGTTLVRLDILYTLDMNPEGLSMGSLSSELFVTNGNISGIVKDLSKSGLVEMAPALTDRRSMIVTITAEGQDYIKDIVESHHEWVEDLLADMSQTQLLQLSELLRALKKSVAPKLEDRLAHDD